MRRHPCGAAAVWRCVELEQRQGWGQHRSREVRTVSVLQPMVWLPWAVSTHHEQASWVLLLGLQGVASVPMVVVEGVRQSTAAAAAVSTAAAAADAAVAWRLVPLDQCAASAVCRLALAVTVPAAAGVPAAD